MRFLLKSPEIISPRIRSGFLFLPRIINQEMRWLEWARWSEYNYKNRWHGINWQPSTLIDVDKQRQKLNKI